MNIIYSYIIFVSVYFMKKLNLHIFRQVDRKHLLDMLFKNMV